MKSFRVIFSTGHGRLHLVESVVALSAQDVQVSLVGGWIPKNPNGVLVRICSWVIGRDLSAGMKKRVLPSCKVNAYSMPVVEFFDQFLRIIDDRLFHGRFHDAVSAYSWMTYGWASRRYLRGAQIFHCRSGAGQGGAIECARRHGMKIVVDHSIAHPLFMDQNLRKEYEKNGAPMTMGMDSKFWNLVDADCQDADVVLVNSFFVKDTFVAAGYDPNKVKIVYLGVRNDFMGLRGERKPLRAEIKPLRLLFTGMFCFRKGAEYILEALKILKDCGVAVEMDVLGSYMESANLIKRYERFDLPIRFHGPIPQDELKSYLSECDVYVFPSLAEGCAKSGMEAMAAGLCVVGTVESGFPITDGTDGYVVPSKDAKAIADKIEWLAANRKDVERVGRNAAKLIRENYTWEKYAEGVKKIYDELLVGL